MNSSNIINQLKRSIAVAKKDLSIYYMKGPVVIFGLLLPAFMFISYSMGRGFSMTHLFPGMLGMGLFFTVSSVGPMIAPWETRMKTFERLVSTPISLWAIILGDIISSILFGLLITSFILIAGAILIGPNVISISVLIGTVLASFCFSSLGTVISSPPTDNPSNVMMLSTLIKFPLIFISGVFVPISEMGSLKTLSYISPLTYYTDLIRHSVHGSGHFGVATDLLMLSIFTIFFTVIAIKLHEKSLPKRF